jgi:hypothetical protein
MPLTTLRAIISLAGMLQVRSRIGLTGPVFFLSGVTPGDREYPGFHRVSASARLRRTAHARSDSLEHSPALSSEQSVIRCRIGEVSSRRRTGC